MSTVQERAAEMILDWFMDHYCRNGGHEVLPDGTALAAALAAAGLLADPTTSRTDAEQAVIDAAKAMANHPAYENGFYGLVLAVIAAVDRLTATEETT